MRVAIGDVDREAAERTAAELGGAVVGLHLDVTDLAGFTAFLDEVERRVGPIDVLVNNAGIMPVTPLEEESAESIARRAPGDQRARRDPRNPGGDPPHAPARRGHIVNVASMAGKSGFPNLATYSATKFAVVGLSEVGPPRAARLGHRRVVRDARSGRHGAIDRPAVGPRRQAITPELVAEEIVGALKVPRFDVFVPRSAGRVGADRRNAPAPGPRGAGPRDPSHQAATHADPRSRAAYESRAAASAPAAEKVADLESEPAEERSAA